MTIEKWLAEPMVYRSVHISKCGKGFEATARESSSVDAVGYGGTMAEAIEDLLVCLRKKESLEQMGQA